MWASQALPTPCSGCCLMSVYQLCLFQSLFSANMIVIKVCIKNWKPISHPALLWIASGMRGIASLHGDLQGSSQNYLDRVVGVTIFSQILQQVSSFSKTAGFFTPFTPRRFLWNWLQKADTDVICRHILHAHTFLILLQFSFFSVFQTWAKWWVSLGRRYVHGISLDN